MAMTGGCHCGAVRYEVDGTPLTHALCHCTDCRRHAGAPVVGWTMYPATALHVLQGTPKIYASSTHGRRHFCGDCGTPLFTRSEVNVQFTSIRFPSLDDASGFAPMLDIWTSRAQPWVCLDARLPRFAESPQQPG